MKKKTHYKPEELHTQIIPRHDRRYYDVTPAPKRRASDPRNVVAIPPRTRVMSAREEELLALIDGHIARLLAERGGSNGGQETVGQAEVGAAE